MFKEIEWTRAMETCLRDQVITADQPGPVLKDFGLVLDYVGTEGVKSAGKYHLLPMACIPELDPHLSRPLALSLNSKRPQIRSHPYLQGLNLLLRATGLARVDGTGAKSRLCLDPVMLEQWNQLNPTEQYFNLLEAWLLYGRPIMVGDLRGRDRGPMLGAIMLAWKFFPRDHPLDDTKLNHYLSIFSLNDGYYQLALMDLFGLMSFGQPPLGSVRWLPTSINPTPIGDALFALLDTKLNIYSGEALSDEAEDEAEDETQDEGEEQDEEAEADADIDSDDLEFGIWQSMLQPYFPEWQANLVIPQRELREGTYLFRVSLGQGSWRRIAIPANDTLDDLLDWILRALKFDSDHLYRFTYTDTMGAKIRVNWPEAEEGPWTDQTLIGMLPLEPGQSMELLYDFGDNWRFDVKLESIEPPAAKPKAARIVESHGKAPKQYPHWEE